MRYGRNMFRFLIYLVNGIKLQGKVDSFDQYVIILKNAVSQMVYKQCHIDHRSGAAGKASVRGQDEVEEEV